MKLRWNSAHDSEIDRKRYESENIVHLSNNLLNLGDGYLDFPKQHIPPFECYYKMVENFYAHIPGPIRVLEIGAGTGQHTKHLLSSKTLVTVLDISESAIAIIEKRFKEQLKGVIGNIESLPFEKESFDLVVSCGALSYGDPEKMDPEICRVLKPGGSLIVLDSLNHNLIYRTNRWFRYLRGNRTLSTILRIPTLQRLQKLGTKFNVRQEEYFGAWIWVFPVMSILLGQTRANALNQALEKLSLSKKYSFKVAVHFEDKKE